MHSAFFFFALVAVHNSNFRNLEVQPARIKKKPIKESVSEVLHAFGTLGIRINRFLIIPRVLGHAPVFGATKQPWVMTSDWED